MVPSISIIDGSIKKICGSHITCHQIISGSSTTRSPSGSIGQFTNQAIYSWARPRSRRRSRSTLVSSRVPVLRKPACLASPHLPSRKRVEGAYHNGVTPPASPSDVLRGDLAEGSLPLVAALSAYASPLFPTSGLTDARPRRLSPLLKPARVHVAVAAAGAVGPHSRAPAIRRPPSS